MIKVTTDHSDDFWTLEEKAGIHRLRIYMRRFDGNVTWKDVIPADVKPFNLSYSRLV